MRGGLRPRLPGDHRPGLPHPAGGPRGPPPPTGPDPMTATAHRLPMILSEVDRHPRRTALAVLRPGRAGQSRARRLRRRRSVLRPAGQARLPERVGRARVVRRSHRVVVRDLARPPVGGARPHADLLGARGAGHRSRHPRGRRHRAAPGGRGHRAGVGLGGPRRCPATGWCCSAPRTGEEFGGIEFEPGTARTLLLAADETAVPAVCRILGGPAADCVRYCLPRSAHGRRRARRTRPSRGAGRLAAAAGDGARRAPGRGGTPPRRAGRGGRPCDRLRGGLRDGGGGPGPVGDPDVLLVGGGCSTGR